jgi:Kdo2-lipid IVA lauroyltransferase/acyltransferase
MVDDIQTALNHVPRRGIAARLAADLPQRYVVGLGKLLGRVAYWVDVRHLRITRRNLHFCFPQWSAAQVHSFSKRVFENFGITAVEMAQLTFLTPEQVIPRVPMEGEEHLSAALKQGRGVIIVSAHLGNWEMAMMAWAMQFQTPVTVVSKKLVFEPFNRWSLELRRPYAIETIWKKGAFPKMMQALRRGNILVVTLDLNRTKNAAEVEFFGKRTSVTLSVAMLALRCKCPVIPACCYRSPNGDLALRIEPPLEMVRTGDLRADLQVNSQLMAAANERAIRRYPEQWLWQQKRWKSFYPDLYPEYWQQRRRRKAKKGKLIERAYGAGSP